MGTAERRRREKDNLRRAILDAARELFVAQGYEAVTMRKIAGAIEYSATTIYGHFKDKDEILVALAEEGFNLLADRLETMTTTDPLEQLRQGGHLYFDFARHQPNYYTIMFELRANALAKDHAPTDTAAHRAFSCIEDAVAEGVARGVFDDTHVPQPILSHAFWASLHGVASLLLSGRLGMLPASAHAALEEAVIENTLRGLQHG